MDSGLKLASQVLVNTLPQPQSIAQGTSHHQYNKYGATLTIHSI